MSDSDALLLLCVYPLIIGISAGVICWITRSLELSARDQDTKRYPQYGRSKYMRHNGKRTKEE